MTCETPDGWTADVLLADGRLATLRTTRPADRALLVDFYAGVSERSRYLRFFASHPELTEADLDAWTAPATADRVTLVATVRGAVVAVAGYAVVDALPGRTADVSFLVRDDQQGRGLAAILLEHLADHGREAGVDRFFAEMLAENRAMIQVFVRAGYDVHPRLESGEVVVDFPLTPTGDSREVMARRAHRAEAAAVRRLLHPDSIAVVGTEAALGPIARAIAEGGFAGSLQCALTSPETIDDAPVPAAGRTAHAVRGLDSPVDLVVAEFLPDELEAVFDAAAELGATGVLMLARGRSPRLAGDEAQRFVAAARRRGLRALGPASLGLIAADEHVRLNASPAPTPRAGRVGLFAQSARVAALVLSRVLERGVGLASAMATGAFADVTANDVMQYWLDDPATEVCLLSLDTAGNPRTFFRVLRRLAAAKPTAVFLPSRALSSARHHEVDGLPAAPPAAVDAVIRHAGAMVVPHRETLVDIAQILARHPAPAGPNVAVIANSAGLTGQMAQAARRYGLVPTAHTAEGDPVPALLSATRDALDSGADAVVVAVVELGEPVLQSAHKGLTRLAADARVPLVAAYTGFGELPGAVTGDAGPEARGELPVTLTYAGALEALAHIALRRSAPASGTADAAGEADVDVARGVVNSVLVDAPAGRELTDDECREVLAAYGVDVLDFRRVASLDEAVAAAEEFGWDVVLKATHPALRSRADLGSAIRNIGDVGQMRAAWVALSRLAKAAGADPAGLTVQATVGPGTSLRVRGIEDPALGPMVSVAVSGPTAELAGDVSWRVAPISPSDARVMLEELAAADLLRGWSGTPAAALEPVAEAIAAVSRLGDDHPALVDVELVPLIAGSRRYWVAGTRARVAPLAPERDPLARAL